MNRLAAFYYGPTAAVRTYALARLLPCMLALDIWVLMIGHAGRYGVAGFNVAHFALLDRVLPVPTDAMYIGLLVSAGLLCLMYALGNRSRWVSVPMFTLYTLSWSWSMLDSYQHHYFMSLVLLCLVLIEPAEAALPALNSAKSEHPQAGGGYVLLTSTVAILYAFAALAKCDTVWLGGHTLRSIGQAERLMRPATLWLANFGVQPQQAFAFLATSVVPLELLVALAYALAPLADRSPSRAVRALMLLGATLALSLHLGAEKLGLQIGWFSYYMLLLPLICLLPASAVRLWVAPLLALEGAVSRALAAISEEMKQSGSSVTSAALSLVVLCFVAYVGLQLDLPGTLPATVLFALCMASYSIASAVRRRLEKSVGAQLGALAAVLCLWLTLAQSEARFDFYRYLGGDQARRGEIGAAIETYEHGERYAPPGASRRRKINSLRRKLGR